MKLPEASFWELTTNEIRGKCHRDKSQNKTFTIILDFDPGNKRSHQLGIFAQSGEDITNYSKSASAGEIGARFTW